MLIEDLQLILKIAEFKNITAAATSLDIRTATASAALKRVEKELGTELFVRTTRHLRLSSAGEKYLPQCEQALLLLKQAKQSMKNELDIVDGELRVAISSDLGRNLVTPWLDELMDDYPNIQLKTHISDSNIDFYRDSIDMAVRYGSPTEANIYGYKICNVPRLLCAAPEYLAKYGTPEHPTDLTTHNALLYQLHNIINDVWKFSYQKEEFKIKMSGDRASNDADIVRRWCVAGKGISVKSCLDMSNDLFEGNVVSLMQNYTPAPTELWLIFPNRQSITPAARLFRDRLREKSFAILNKLIERNLLDDNIVIE